jgi:hypothetical protein
MFAVHARLRIGAITGGIGVIRAWSVWLLRKASGADHRSDGWSDAK